MARCAGRFHGSWFVARGSLLACSAGLVSRGWGAGLWGLLYPIFFKIQAVSLKFSIFYFLLTIVVEDDCFDHGCGKTLNANLYPDTSGLNKSKYLNSNDRNE